jgi:GNAT superfamily N-acetyltransferase
LILLGHFELLGDQPKTLEDGIEADCFELRYLHDEEVDALGQPLLLGRIVWTTGYTEAEPEVIDIFVHQDYRRRGIATALWHEAHVYDPKLVHSEMRTIDGQAWALSLGEPLPTWRLA